VAPPVRVPKASEDWRAVQVNQAEGTVHDSRDDLAAASVSARGAREFSAHESHYQGGDPEEWAELERAEGLEAAQRWADAFAARTANSSEGEGCEHAVHAVGYEHAVGPTSNAHARNARTSGKVSEPDGDNSRRSPVEGSSMEYGARIQAIYEEHNPAKLADVPALLEKYEGSEAEMYQRICDKYGVTPDPPLLPERRGRGGQVPRQRYAKKAGAPVPPVSIATGHDREPLSRSKRAAPSVAAPPAPPAPAAPAVSSLFARFQSLVGAEGSDEPEEEAAPSHGRYEETRYVETRYVEEPRHRSRREGPGWSGSGSRHVGDGRENGARSGSYRCMAGAWPETRGDSGRRDRSRHSAERARPSRRPPMN